MFPENISEYITSCFADFVPVWKWKYPLENKKEKNKSKHDIDRIVSICRKSEYILGILTVLFVISFARSRHVIVSSIFRFVTFFIVETLSCIILGYVLGLKRLPTNYISLVIIKTFTILDNKFLYRPQDTSSSASQVLLGNISLEGLWSLVQIPSRDTRLPAPPANLYVRNTGLVILFLASLWCCGKYTKISLSKYTGTVIFVQSIATSLAAVLLITTFSFDVLPGIVAVHLKFCELWTLFALTTLIFAVAFLAERLQSAITSNRKAILRPRVEWETFIFMLALSITIEYIPMIHPSFSFRNLLSNKTARMLETFVPTELMNYGKILMSYAANATEMWRDFMET